MRIDQEYENTEAAEGGNYIAPPPGGYIFQVLEVSEKPSSSGKDMITLTLDIADGEFEGAFQRFPKKYCQLVNGDNLPYFKAMIEAFQTSNPERGRLIQGGNFDPQRLTGAVVGGCIREEEYQDRETREIKVGLKVAWLCDLEKVGDIKPPKLKKLAGGQGASRPAAYASAGRAPQADDDLPF
jgi:hypothetical protein